MSRSRRSSQGSSSEKGSRGRALVLGLGNPDGGDDAIGLEVARELARRGRGVAEAFEPFAVLDWLARPCRHRASVVVDAMVSGAPPGTLRRFDVTTAPLPEPAFALSTHGFGLAKVVELARALDRLGPRLFVLGVEAERFESGAPLSPPVARAARAASDEIERLLWSRG